MAISEHASGIRTVGTPPEANFTVLGTTEDTTDGCYQFVLDLQNMQKGDVVEVQVLESVVSGNTANVVFESVISNSQDEPIFFSPALILLHKWSYRMRQTAGSVRAYNWSIRKVA